MEIWNWLLSNWQKAKGWNRSKKAGAHPTHLLNRPLNQLAFVIHKFVETD